MGVRTTKGIRSALLAFIAIVALPVCAFGWKPNTHVYIANIILADAQDGKVWIPPYGEFNVSPEAMNAISWPDMFRAGSVGPDGFPDIFTGQLSIHPNTDAWLSYMWNVMQNEWRVSEAWAFMFGFLTHCGGDNWCHDWVNYYAGGPWQGLSEFETASSPTACAMIDIKHLAIEATLNRQVNPSDEDPPAPDLRVRLQVPRDRPPGPCPDDLPGHRPLRGQVLGEVPVAGQEPLVRRSLVRGPRGRPEGLGRGQRNRLEEGRGERRGSGWIPREQPRGMGPDPHPGHGGPAVRDAVDGRSRDSRAEAPPGLRQMGSEPDRTRRADPAEPPGRVRGRDADGHDRHDRGPVERLDERRSQQRAVSPRYAGEDPERHRDDSRGEPVGAQRCERRQFAQFINGINGPLYNSVITGKLALLPASEIDRLIGGNHFVASGTPNVLLGTLRSIDQGRQWADGLNRIVARVRDSRVHPEAEPQSLDVLLPVQALSPGPAVFRRSPVFADQPSSRRTDQSRR